MLTPVTNRWVKIQYTQKGNPFFVHQSKRVAFKNIIRAHNNPWVGNVLPDFIHGFTKDYWNPIFVEVNRSNTAVKVYKIA